ncbi:MAG: bifunctional pyr operon transcriptional regulator/uracil phosphoribosyltransferase PyrR [Gemmatimonadota bacterium]
MVDSQRQLVMDENTVQRTIARMAREIVESNQGVSELWLIGIQRRGVHLAAYLADEIEKTGFRRPSVGTLDITLYRDDLTAVGPRPVLGETRLPSVGIDGRNVVIVDDVVYTGRTVRAALDELADFGRPARIQLCVLVDRGGRELPIQPDIIGQKIDVQNEQVVEFRVPAIDGSLAVEIVQRGGS